jgi:signal transduction histidine kinase
VEITVGDDGCGFDPKSLSGHAGLGLANVRERLSLAFRDATLALSSQLGVGTHVTIEIPIQSIARTAESEASRAK